MSPLPLVPIPRRSSRRPLRERSWVLFSNVTAGFPDPHAVLIILPVACSSPRHVGALLGAPTLRLRGTPAIVTPARRLSRSLQENRPRHLSPVDRQLTLIKLGNINRPADRWIAPVDFRDLPDVRRHLRVAAAYFDGPRGDRDRVAHNLERSADGTA
jgi:hypothetical protein